MNSWCGHAASLHRSVSISTPQTLSCPVNKPRLVFLGDDTMLLCIDPIVTASHIKGQSCQADDHLTSDTWVNSGKLNWDKCRLLTNKQLFRSKLCAYLFYYEKLIDRCKPRIKMRKLLLLYCSVVMVWIRRVTWEVHVLKVWFLVDGAIERRFDHRVLTFINLLVCS